MVWSPSVRVHTSENANNAVARKPGNNLLSRKPFLDRSINSKTPDAAKLLKQKECIGKETATAVNKPSKSPKSDLKGEEFIFSFKEVEDVYNDIWPCVTKENIVKILRNYCNAEDDVPKPSLEMSEPIFSVFDDLSPLFVEMPSAEIPQLIDEDLWNTTFDVEVPEYDLNMSV